MLTILGIILRASGVEVATETLSTAQAELINLYPELLEFLGLIWAAYGRVKATGGITLKKGEVK